MTEKEKKAQNEARREALLKRARGEKGVPYEKNDTPEHERSESAAERKKEGE